MKGSIEIPLLDMIDQLGEQQVSKLLSDFSCPYNRDVESFLKLRAIEFAKQKITQTQLIFMQYKGKPRLVGYYSLTNKIISIKDDNLSKSLKKRISKYGVRDAFNKGFMISAPLIAQLGKNFSDNLNTLLTGDELLKIALDKVAQALLIIGGKVVYLECDDSPKLLEFYSRNGFIQFGERPKSSEDYDRVEGTHLVQLLKIIK